MIVADCTLLTHLYVESQNTEAARLVLRKDDSWTMPPLWRSEFRNVLVKYVRAQTLSLDGALTLFARAEETIAPKEQVVSSSDVLSLAIIAGCSAYDAEYVMLAKLLGAPLVTSDRRLLRLFPTLATTPAAFAAA